MVTRRMLCLLALYTAILGGTSLPSADAVRPRPSTFAPAADLIRQLESFLKRIGEDLASESDYGEDQRSRVAKDASTVIVLGQLLALHDESHALKGAAPAIVVAAQPLVAAVEDYAKAHAALVALRKALESNSTDKITAEPIAEIGLLMKQVPIVNNALRRGVTGTRFAKTLDVSAAQAATLAAIAELSSYDKSYCESDADRVLWDRVCGEMRDAAAAIVVAVRKPDAMAANAGLERLVKTCDACHERFRPEAK